MNATTKYTKVYEAKVIRTIPGSIGGYTLAEGSIVMAVVVPSAMDESLYVALLSVDGKRDNAISLDTAAKYIKRTGRVFNTTVEEVMKKCDKLHNNRVF